MPRLIDVTGNGKHYVNLELVRYIRVEDLGEKSEILFAYVGGDEDVFHISPDRLAVIEDVLQDLRVLV